MQARVSINETSRDTNLEGRKNPSIRFWKGIACYAHYAMVGFPPTIRSSMTMCAVSRASVPDYYKYMDWSLAVLGIPQKPVELLEKHLGITTVRKLLQATRQDLLSVPQFSGGNLNVVFQCLANHGFPVPGFSPAQTRVECMELQDYDDSYGLGDMKSMRLYSPSNHHVVQVHHPSIKPRTSLPPEAIAEAKLYKKTKQNMATKKPAPAAK